MSLYIQICSLIVSFLYGCMFALELILFDKLVCKMSKILKFFFSFLFVMANAILYFIVLLIINNGILHVYFFLLMICGYFLFNKLFHFLFTHFRKKS